MPIYEFRCDPCDVLFEEILPVGNRARKRCPECRKPARRVISRSSFRLEGSGWYATDYKKPSGKSPGDVKTGETSSPAR
jgi:putative FmdB family regulatory protein